MARTLGCTVEELGDRMSAEEFQGHIDDLYPAKESEPEQMTPERMAQLLGVNGD